MILSALAFTLALQTPTIARTAPAESKAVTLNRVFSKGEKMQYQVSSNLHTETQIYGSPTFMPADLDMNYKFTAEVKELKPDGIAVLHYLRPAVVEVAGETADHGPIARTRKLDWNYDVTVSPINKVIDTKDLNPAKPKKHGDGGEDSGNVSFFVHGFGGRAQSLNAFLGQFITEVHRLALNIGPIDSSLDFAPKLPLDDVKVGDTWRDTVGYEPQSLKGKDGKQAVQRLDYTFTYGGIVTVNGRQYHRVTAVLDLNTDLASFINQLADMKPEETHLKSIPLTLKQKIDYNLDLATKRTISAYSTAEGGFKINITDITSEPVEQQSLKGTTEMKLVGSGTATVAPRVAGHHGRH